MADEKKEVTAKPSIPSKYVVVVKDGRELEVPRSTLEAWLKNGYKEK